MKWGCGVLGFFIFFVCVWYLIGIVQIMEHVIGGKFKLGRKIGSGSFESCIWVCNLYHHFDCWRKKLLF